MPKKVSYEIKMKDGTSQTVEGLIVNDIYGIDKRVFTSVVQNKDGSERTLSSSGFYLTHIPSGGLITNANTQKALKELVNRPNMVGATDPNVIMKEVGAFWNEREWKG